MNWILFWQLVILFFLSASAGWTMEVTLKYIQFHRFVNRGFLIGPYCPIYGWGTVIVTVLVGGLIGYEGTVSEIFFAGFVMCGVLEYFTSWYMEKVFHARWWDYSQKPMNLHGRIWIGNLILFGLASVFIVCFVDPIYFSLISKVSPFWLHFFGVMIILIFATDYIASHVLMNVVKKEIDAQVGDNTEEITKRIHELLQNRNSLYRRIEKAYPNLHTRPHWLTLQIRQAKKDYKEASRQVSDILKKIKRHKKHLLDISELNELLDKTMKLERERLHRLRTLQKKQLHHFDDEK